MGMLFFLRLALSFIVGGLWVVAATVLADRSGSKIAGFISGLPSTVVLGLFFIAWTQDPGAAVQATTVIPLVGGINSLFVATYVYFVRRTLGLALVSSLTLWFALAYGLLKTNFNDYALSLLGFGCLFSLSFLLLEKIIMIASTEGKVVRYTPSLILVRALIGGWAVSLAVFLGKVGGPLWGGIFSTFPAMFISTMLITYFGQGPLLSAAVMKSALLSALSVVVYAVVARLTYLPLGLWLGTGLSLLVSYGSGLAIYRLVIMKLR